MVTTYSRRHPVHCFRPSKPDILLLDRRRQPSPNPTIHIARPNQRRFCNWISFLRLCLYWLFQVAMYYFSGCCRDRCRLVSRFRFFLPGGFDVCVREWGKEGEKSIRTRCMQELVVVLDYSKGQKNHRASQPPVQFSSILGFVLSFRFKCCRTWNRGQARELETRREWDEKSSF